MALVQGLELTLDLVLVPVLLEDENYIFTYFYSTTTHEIIQIKKSQFTM